MTFSRSLRDPPGRSRKGWALLTLTLIAGCTHNRTPRRPAFHVQVLDPAGDATAVAGVAQPPDLTGGTVDVREGSATFDIRFAPGTLDPSTTRLTIELDTDQLESTGIHTTYGLGIDYVLDLWAPTRQALLLKAVPSGACTRENPCYTRVADAPLILLPDEMRVSINLSELIPSDGRIRFRVLAYAMAPGVTQQAPTRIADYMPDFALPPARVE